MPHPFFGLPTPLVMGHRGAAGERPENTLPSFEHALAQGAVILESDVHASRDGHVMVFHDDTLERTTDGSGPLADLDLAALQSLDAGYRFEADGGFPYRGRGVRIPTLDEAFARLPDARFNLELKALEPALIQGVVDLVRRHDRAERTLLTAGHDVIMKELRGALAETELPVATGACLSDIVGFIKAAERSAAPPPGVHALQVPTAFGGNDLVTADFVAAAHRHGIQVHVWTINDPDEMRRLFDLGVDGIISDHPARVTEVVAERRGRS